MVELFLLDRLRIQSRDVIFHLEENIISQGPELPVPIFYHAIVDIEDYISMIIGGLMYKPFGKFRGGSQITFAILGGWVV